MVYKDALLRTWTEAWELNCIIFGTLRERDL